MVRCKECGGETVSSQGEIVCTHCGLVIGESHTLYVDSLFNKGRSPFDSRILGQNEIGSRPYFVGGLGAYIGFNRSFFFKDRNGRPLSEDKQHLFGHLKATYDRQNRFRGHETTYRCFCSLNRVAEILRLPRMVSQRAAYLFRKAIRSQRRVKGATSVTLMGYCVFLATREFDRTIPSRIREITAAFRRLGHRVTVKSVLRLGSEYRDLLAVRQQPFRSEDYLVRILDKVVSDAQVLHRLGQVPIDPLGYQHRMISVSSELLGRINGADRGGRNPYVFAVSTVYAGERCLARESGRKTILTQKILAKIAGVAEYSIREHFCSVLKRHLDSYELIVPQHSQVFDPSEGTSSLHLKPIRISRRR